MAQPAYSPLPDPTPAKRSEARPDETLTELGEGPVAALQQMLVTRIADWPSVADPFAVEGPRQIIEEIVSTVSRAAGYICLAAALVGVGTLIYIA
jgi:nitroreductase